MPQWISNRIFQDGGEKRRDSNSYRVPIAIGIQLRA